MICTAPAPPFGLPPWGVGGSKTRGGGGGGLGGAARRAEQDGLERGEGFGVGLVLYEDERAPSRGALATLARDCFGVEQGVECEDGLEIGQSGGAGDRSRCHPFG